MRAIYKEELGLDGHRQTFSLPGESNCSKWVNQNATREDVNPDGGEGRRDPGILHQMDWHTNEIFFLKEKQHQWKID